MNKTIKYLTVTSLNRYISYKFETDQHFKILYVKGEISNSRYSKGSLYFSLKDEKSEISAIMFQSNLAKLSFTPCDGMNILCETTISVYEKKGTYNLVVSKMTEVGLGVSYLEFLKLKDKLQKEGLFNQKYKLPIPDYISNLGIITSENGDALNDVLTTISKRYPLIKIFVYPALVQGQDAASDLIRALNFAFANHTLDCIVITRGGGSIEDLSCFNDEALARTIFKSKIPIISAVGHENDFTICDFVSSLRCPTPTAAGIRVSKDKNELLKIIDNLSNVLNKDFQRVITEHELEYFNIVNNPYFSQYSNFIDQKIVEVNNLNKVLNMLSPLSYIKEKTTELNNLSNRLNLISLDTKIDLYNQTVLELANDSKMIMLNNINNLSYQIDNLIDKLIICNPLNLMKKGYALTYSKNKIVTSITQVNVGDELLIKHHDGDIISKIIDLKGEINGKAI